MKSKLEQHLKNIKAALGISQWAGNISGDTMRDFETSIDNAIEMLDDYTSELRAELEKVTLEKIADISIYQALKSELESVKAERDELKQSSPARFVSDDEIEAHYHVNEDRMSNGDHDRLLKQEGAKWVRDKIFFSPPEPIRTKEEIYDELFSPFMSVHPKDLILKAMQIYHDQFRTVRSDLDQFFLDQAKDRIEAVGAEQWISVEERLPEKDGIYWVYTSCNEQGARGFELDDDGEESIWLGLENVTHWQPFPSPPNHLRTAGD